MKSIALLALLSSLLFVSTAVAESKPQIIYQPDTVYGRVHGAGLLADIAYPKTDKKLKAIISVHGGRWQGGHKRDGSIRS